MKKVKGCFLTKGSHLQQCWRLINLEKGKGESAWLLGKAGVSRVREKGSKC